MTYREVRFFEGKRYRLHAYNISKAAADSMAIADQKDGFYTRTVPTSNGYAVYVRGGKDNPSFFQRGGTERREYMPSTSWNDPAKSEAKKSLLDAKGDIGGKIYVLLIQSPSGYESSVFHSTNRSQIEQQEREYKKYGNKTKIVRVSHYGD
jgi:hypothetical protein